MANSLSLYQELKQFGFQDDHIIVLNALDSQCDLRNPYPGNVYIDTSINSSTSVYNEEIEIDYIGEDVNFLTIFQLLSGRHSSFTSLSKRLQTNSNSNILLFFTGHGGNQFFKFQDYEEISSSDFLILFNEMKLKQRFNNLLFLVDTCQASTLTQSIENISGLISISSSNINENSYAYLTNKYLGISVIDRFTYSLIDYLKKYRSQFINSQNQQNQKKTTKKKDTILDFYQSFQSNFLHSTPILHISNRNQLKENEKISIKEFFTSSVNGILLNKIKNNEESQSIIKKNYEKELNNRVERVLKLYNNAIDELE